MTSTSNTLCIIDPTTGVSYQLGDECFNLPEPVLLDGYTKADGYTVSNFSSPELVGSGMAGVGGVKAVLTLEGENIVGHIRKISTKGFIPSKMGVVASLIYFNGNKTAAEMTLTAGVINTTVNYPDANGNARRNLPGWKWMSFDTSTSPTFAALNDFQTVRYQLEARRNSGSVGPLEVIHGLTLANAAGRPSIIITADDMYGNQYTNLFQKMVVEAGLTFTCMVLPQLVDYGTRLTLVQLQVMRAAGVAMCANGTWADGEVSTDPEVSLPDLRAVQKYLIDNDLSRDGSHLHGCWPNGKFDAARGATFSEAGMLSMRTINPEYLYDRFGLADQAMAIPSKSIDLNDETGASVNDAIDKMDIAIAAGASFRAHVHGASSISAVTALVSAIKDRVDAGLADCLTIPQWYQRVRGKQPPVLIADQSGRSGTGVISTPTGDAILGPSGLHHLVNSLSWTEFKTLLPQDYTGRLVYVTDIGDAGSLWRSTGVYWLPVHDITLAAQTTKVEKSNIDNQETALFEYLLPGGLMGLNSTIRIEPVWTFPAGNDNKSLKVLFASRPVFNKTRGVDNGTSSAVMAAPLIDIINRNAANQQLFPYDAPGLYTTSSNASVGVMSIDTMQDVPISVKVKWGGEAGDGTLKIALESCRVRMLP